MNIDNSDEVVRILNEWYSTPVYKLSHYLEATLSNSNPLLHPCRLYVLFKDWTPEKFIKPFLIYMMLIGTMNHRPCGLPVMMN